MTVQTGDNSTKWIIHEERVVDDTRKARFSIAHVELPDGVHFEQLDAGGAVIRAIATKWGHLTIEVANGLFANEAATARVVEGPEGPGHLPDARDLGLGNPATGEPAPALGSRWGQQRQRAGAGSEPQASATRRPGDEVKRLKHCFSGLF